jgi:hypothetical protein
MAIETISVLDAAGATKTVLADLIGSDYGQVLKVSFGSDGSLTLVDASNGLPVNIVAPASIPVSPAMASTGTQTSVSASATSVTLKASNASRKSIAIYNDSTADLYLVTSAVAASTSVFTVKLTGGGIFYDDGYTGEIRGIWSSATGSARITERT